MSRARLDKAPYNSAGYLMDYVGYTDAHEWRENKPFAARLTLDGTERGRSAARFFWNTEDGRPFKMFLTDMANLVKSGASFHDGSVFTWWTVCKRGRNYGIRRASQDDLWAAGHTGGRIQECLTCIDAAPHYLKYCPVTKEFDANVMSIRDAFDAGMYPSSIGIFCDACGTEEVGDYLVRDASTQSERFELARTHLRTQGWRCNEGGDLCPTCKTTIPCSRCEGSTIAPEDSHPADPPKPAVIEPCRACQH